MRHTENIFNTTLEILNHAEVNNQTPRAATLIIAKEHIKIRKKELEK